MDLANQLSLPMEPNSDNHCETTWEIDEWLSLADTNLSSYLEDYYSTPTWSVDSVAIENTRTQNYIGLDNANVHHYNQTLPGSQLNPASPISANEIPATTFLQNGDKSTRSNEPLQPCDVCPTCSQPLPTGMRIRRPVHPKVTPPVSSRRGSQFVTVPRSFLCKEAGCNATFVDGRSLARHRSCVHDAPVILPCGAERKNRRDNILRHIRKCSTCSRAKQGS